MSALQAAQAALLLLLAGAACYHLLAWVLVRRFEAGTRPFRGAAGEAPGGGGPSALRSRWWPGVTQIKPVRKVDPQLESCLASALAQDYPGPHQVLVAADGEVPGLDEVLAGLARRWPRVPVSACREPGPGSNRKIAGCAAAARQARHAIVVLSDQDMRMPAHHLRAVVQPFGDPEVGLVTCLYTARRVRGLGGAFEGLSIADFASSVLVARQVEGLSFALGATMAVRREALDAIGGLEALRDYLADDYQLGNRLAAAGWRVVLAPVVVEDVQGSVPFSEYFSHQLRWMRTYRICRPGGHAAFLVTQGTLWALGLLAASGGSPVGWGALGAWSLVRIGTCAATWRALARSPVAWWALAAPLKDVLWLLLWVLSLGGSRVRWGDTLYRLQRDGRMEPA